MKRRSILCMPLLGLFSSLSYSKNDALVAKETSHSRVVFSELSTMFSDLDSAAAVGDKYLADHPQLNNKELLLSNMGLNESTETAQAQTLFEMQRAKDYLLSNTVNLDGWVLSMAEVSVCCAISLLISDF